MSVRPALRGSALLLATVFALTLAAPALCSAEEITIEISPRTLNLQSDGEVVTVHTDIAYWVVEAASIYLNGVAIEWSKADNHGDFVAKFVMDEIKSLDGLIIDDYNTLVLMGMTRDGTPFWGSAEVMVIDRSTRD